MESIKQTYGKGRWERKKWVYFPESGIEFVILDLLSRIDNLYHQEWMAQNGGEDSYIDVAIEYENSREELYKELRAVLA